MANDHVIIEIEPASEIPPYQQICEQIRGAIQRDELAPAAALPTVRQLANDLNVAPNTVARAYADLQGEGWLTSDGRRGTRVASRLPTVDRRIRTNVLRERVEDFVAALIGRGYSASEILREVQKSTR